MQSPLTEIAIALPFTIGSTGLVIATSSQEKIWEDRVRSVIGTSVGERVMRHNFGSNLYGEVFENETDVAEKVRGIVFDAFTTHVKVLELDDVSTSFDESSGVMTITIGYRLPNNELKTLTVNSIVADGDSLIQGTFTLRGKYQPIEGM